MTLFQPLENSHKSVILEHKNCSFSENHKAGAALFILDGKDDSFLRYLPKPGETVVYEEIFIPDDN